jgi:hypothetical protein
MVVDQVFERDAWFGGKKRPNLGSLQLLKEVFNIKTMLKMNANILGNAMAV